MLVDEALDVPGFEFGGLERAEGGCEIELDVSAILFIGERGDCGFDGIFEPAVEEFGEFEAASDGGLETAVVVMKGGDEELGGFLARAGVEGFAHAAAVVSAQVDFRFPASIDAAIDMAFAVATVAFFHY
jgi:hypothetical protein